MPPIAKKPTRNITLINPAETPSAEAIPANTPPKILSFLLRFIINIYFKNYDELKVIGLDFEFSTFYLCISEVK